MSNILKYNKSELKIGDILLFRSPMIKPVGYLIQCAIRTRYSHLAIYIGEGRIVEALPLKGVVISPLETYVNTKICVKRLRERLEPFGEHALIVWLHEQCGKGYDYLAFIRMAICMTAQKWGLIPSSWRKATPIIENADRYHCFQLGAHAFKAYRLFEDIALDNCYDDDFVFSPKLITVMED